MKLAQLWHRTLCEALDGRAAAAGAAAFIGAATLITAALCRDWSAAAALASPRSGASVARVDARGGEAIRPCCSVRQANRDVDCEKLETRV